MKAPCIKFISALSLFASANCFADWDGGIEIGASTDERPTFRLFAKNQSDPLSHHVYLDWIRESNGSSYRLGYNPTFTISHSVYSFGRFSIEQDKFGDIDREIDALVGVGNNLFQRGSTQVKVETGVGGRLQKIAEIGDEKDGFFFLSGSMTSSILPLVRFDASINAKAGSNQTTTDSEAGFSIPIGPGTALRYVYSDKRHRFDDRPELDLDRKKTFFKITHGF